MRESEFIQKNKSDWQRLDEVLDTNSGNPDEIHQLFLKVSADLSYAQTFFPRRSVRWYLNHLVSNVFDEIRKNQKKNPFQKFIHFYNVTLPKEILRNRNAFYISLLAFSIAIAIGFYSSMQEENYPAYILGDAYVEMTEENINKGLPFDVYRGDNDMGFVRITFNNILVAVRTYALGILAGVGTILILLYNGIMLGAFEAFFYQRDLFADSLLTIWIHGTIEILSIVIAGAAGLIVGRHMLFPGTFSRLESLKIGAKRSITIIISTIPLFVIAGFFESFLTPTPMSDWSKGIIIAFSFVLMMYIYVFKPYMYLKSGQRLPNFDDTDEEIIEAPGIYLSSNQSSTFVKKSFHFFGEHLSEFIKYFYLPLMLCLPLALYFHFLLFENDYLYDGEKNLLNHLSRGGLSWLLYNIVFFVGMCAAIHQQLDWKKSGQKTGFGNMIKRYWSSYLLFSTIYIVIPYMIDYNGGVFLILLLFPPSLISLTMAKLGQGMAQGTAIAQSFSQAYRQYGTFIVTLLSLMVLLLIGLGLGLLFFSLISTINDFFKIFEDNFLNAAFIANISYYVLFYLCFPISILLFFFKQEQVITLKTSTDIDQKLNLWYRAEA